MQCNNRKSMEKTIGPSPFSRCHMESLTTSQKNLTFVQVLGQFESNSNSFSAALDVLAVGQKARKGRLDSDPYAQKFMVFNVYPHI